MIDGGTGANRISSVVKITIIDKDIRVSHSNQLHSDHGGDVGNKDDDLDDVVIVFGGVKVRFVMNVSSILSSKKENSRIKRRKAN